MSKTENLTPERMRCAIQVSCPSLHRLEDGRLYAVLKKASGELELRLRSDLPPAGTDEEAVIIPAALLDTYVEEKVADLRAALKTPYISLHMDGRNEHGTHLLEGAGGCSIPQVEEVMAALDPRDSTAEEIFKEAEKAGHSAGHMIVTRWRWVVDEHGYWEFDAIDPLLTSVMHGDASQQDAEIRALSPSTQGDA
jgi:hypothetical protein